MRACLSRPSLTWCLLAAYALVASGLPLPGARLPSGGNAAKRLATKDRSRPFPCMDTPCGCDTAERCFTNCCCHTPAETLAWARAQGTDPAVIAQLERRTAAPARPVVRSAPSCCSHAASGPLAPDRAPGPTPDEAELCRDFQPLAAVSPPDARCPAAADATPPEQPPTRVVVLRAMLACEGLVAQWFAFGNALPPPPAEAAITTGAALPARLTLRDEAASSGLRAPEPPPPRAA